MKLIDSRFQSNAFTKVAIFSLWFFMYVVCVLLILDIPLYRLGNGFNFSEFFTLGKWPVFYYPLIFWDCRDIDKGCYLYSHLAMFLTLHILILVSFAKVRYKIALTIENLAFWSLCFGLLGFAILLVAKRLNLLLAQPIGYDLKTFNLCFYYGLFVGLFFAISCLWLNLKFISYCRAKVIAIAMLISSIFLSCHINDLSTPFSVQSSYIQHLIFFACWTLWSCMADSIPKRNGEEKVSGPEKGARKGVRIRFLEN